MTNMGIPLAPVLNNLFVDDLIYLLNSFKLVWGSLPNDDNKSVFPKVCTLVSIEIILLCTEIFKSSEIIFKI